MTSRHCKAGQIEFSEPKWVLGPMVMLKRLTPEAAVPFTVMSDTILNQATGYTQFRSAAECRKQAAIGKCFSSTVLLRCPLPYKTCRRPFPLVHLGSEGSGRLGAWAYPGPLGLENDAPVLSSAHRLTNAATGVFPSSGGEGREAMFEPCLLAESRLLNLKGLPWQPAGFALYRHNVDKGSAG